MIQSILIIGGGGAGWITANVLHAALARGPGAPVEITLVESPNVPPIGVGEATVPSIRRTLRTIGLTESQFMTASDATFKNLIRFVDWNQGSSFDHPFDRRARPDTDASVDAWLAADESRAPFARAFSILSNVSDRNLAPKAVGWPDFGSTFPYAYHLDATRLAVLLASVGERRGVRRKLTNIAGAAVGEDGAIAHVSTDQGETLTADLYVDCTGFRSVLAGEALGVPLDEFGDKLLCDRAVAMQIPYDVHRPEHIRPYTIAAARSAGWSWDINLQNRRGVGYVYSSSFISDDEAEIELRAAEGPHSESLSGRIIDFTSGKRRQSWTQNCVAVGLADGFLEPLESSGLYMIEFAAHALAELIPCAGATGGAARNQFNRQMTALYAEVAEYINLHYVLSTRRDTPFWRAATDDAAVIGSLEDRLALWRRKRPTDLDFDAAQRLFSLESYEYLLFGMNYAPRLSSNAAGPMPSLSGTLEKCYEKLPTHEAWLSSLA